MQVDPSELTEPDGAALSGIKAALAVRPVVLPSHSCKGCTEYPHWMHGASMYSLLQHLLCSAMLQTGIIKLMVTST